MGRLRINSLLENPSLCDGYGYRTVLFLQGCNLRCKGCQNPSTWDPTKGTEVDVRELAQILRDKVKNKNKSPSLKIMGEFGSSEPELPVILAWRLQ